MKVLVTGGTGFIGSHLVEALVNRGYDIRCLVRNTSNVEHLEKLSTELIYGDINDKDTLSKAVKGIDIVYHLAGMLGQWGIPNRTYWEVHYQGTENLIQACLKEDLKRFIHCSSTGVLGPITNTPADETHPYNPTNIYEKTKAKAEALVLEAHHKYNLPVTIIRPEFVYGPGDMHVLRLFKAIEHNRFLRIGRGNSYLHPTYISDLVYGLLLVIDKEDISLGQIYHITGEKFITVNELLSLMYSKLGKKNPNIYIPYRLGWISAGIFQLLSIILRINPPLTISTVKFFNENRGFTSMKAEKELDYYPVVTLAEGIEKTIMWYRQNGYL